MKTYAHAAFAAVLCLGACTQIPLVPYDRSAERDNKTIGLLTVAWPSGPSSVLAANVGASFGLVGALVNGAIQSSRESDLTHMLTDQQVNANAIFVSSLTTELQKEGYAVTPVAADVKRSDFLKAYPPASANPVDSYFDIVVTNYGYAAAGMGSSAPYRPWLQAKVKLIKASTGSVLLEDIISYNSLFTIKNVVTLSPDPAYAFPAWSDANADAKKTADGVAAAASQSAVAIADLAK
jgi:hypothetical protein